MMTPFGAKPLSSLAAHIRTRLAKKLRAAATIAFESSVQEPTHVKMTVGDTRNDCIDD